LPPVVNALIGNGMEITKSSNFPGWPLEEYNMKWMELQR